MVCAEFVGWWANVPPVLYVFMTRKSAWRPLKFGLLLVLMRCVATRFPLCRREFHLQSANDNRQYLGFCGLHSVLVLEAHGQARGGQYESSRCGWRGCRDHASAARAQNLDWRWWKSLTLKTETNDRIVAFCSKAKFHCDWITCHKWNARFWLRNVKILWGLYSPPAGSRGLAW